MNNVFHPQTQLKSYEDSWEDFEPLPVLQFIRGQRGISLQKGRHRPHTQTVTVTHTHRLTNSVVDDLHR